MDQLNKIFEKIEELLPTKKVIEDLRSYLHEEIEYSIKIEESEIKVSNTVRVDLIAYVLQYGPNGESSQIRLTMGIGGVTYYSGVGVPEICFAKMIYNLNLSLRSVDFYSRLI
jgi:hypothetical protein